MPARNPITDRRLFDVQSLSRLHLAAEGLNHFFDRACSIHMTDYRDSYKPVNRESYLLEFDIELYRTVAFSYQ